MYATVHTPKLLPTLGQLVLRRVLNIYLLININEMVIREVIKLYILVNITRILERYYLLKGYMKITNKPILATNHLNAQIKV